MNASNGIMQKHRLLTLRSALKKGLFSLAIIVSPALLTQTAFAESMSMPVSEQGDQHSQKPANGQKMENVEIQFGSPIQKINPVGEPPITKWVYQSFTVYFEHETVLHTVVHKG